MTLDEADKADREDSPRETPLKFVKLEDRCAPDLRPASLDEPGIGIGEVEKPDVVLASSLSVAEPRSASVVLPSRFKDEGVEPPEDWLRSLRLCVVHCVSTAASAWCDRSLLDRVRFLLQIRRLQARSLHVGVSRCFEVELQSVSD